MPIVDVTARDAQLNWISDSEMSKLHSHVDHCFNTHFGSAPIYFDAHRAVSEAMVSITQRMPTLGPFSQRGSIGDVVTQSLCDNLRKPVRDALMTEFMQHGIVRKLQTSTDVSDFNTQQQHFGGVFPHVFRFQSECEAPLNNAQRRRVYNELVSKRFVEPLLTLHTSIDFDAIAHDLHKRVPHLKGVMFGVSAHPPSQYLRRVEDGRDSFVIHNGDHVVAELTTPAHAVFHRRHSIFSNEIISQYNFMLELPVTLLLGHRSIVIPISMLDWTVSPKNPYWSTVRTRGAVVPFTVHPNRYEVNYYSTWCASIVKACSGYAAQAGAFFAFACSDSSLHRLDAFCDRVRDALPQLTPDDWDTADGHDVIRTLWNRFYRVVQPVWSAMQSDEEDVATMPLAVSSRAVASRPSQYNSEGSRGAAAWLYQDGEGRLRGRAGHVFAHDFYAVLRKTVDAMIASHVLGRHLSVTYVSAVSIEDTFI